MVSICLAVALVAAIVGISFTAAGTAYRWRGTRGIASLSWVFLFLGLGAAVVVHGLEAERFPLTTRSEYLLALGLAVSAIHLFVWFRLRLFVAGLVIPPVSALACLLGWNLLSAESPTLAVEKAPGWFLFHTTFATLGMAILCLAFAMSVLYLVQDRALKARKRLTLLQKLPALDKCDAVGFQAMVVGFVLLTIGIATGLIVNTSVHERIWIFGAKQDTAALTWAVFAALIFSRRLFGFRGRKSAYLTIAGFILGLATVVGMTI
jgi:ABC-type uncharacterized transport system permease subunit